MTLDATRSAVLAIGLLVLTSGVAARAETFLECQAGQVSDDDFEAVACAVQFNDQLWHDAEEIHDFCRESATVTGCHLGTQCVGRCGPGCGLLIGAGTYRLDCAEHDRCCRQHGNCFSPAATYCGDEWRDAADDFIFGARSCGTCALTAPAVPIPTTSWDPAIILGIALLASVLLLRHFRRLRTAGTA